MTSVLADLSQLSGFAQDSLWVGILVFLRVGGAMAMMPGLGEAPLPARIRLALSLAYTAIVAPAVGPSAQIDPAIGPLLAEAAAGLVLGFGFRMIVAALQIAAAIAAQATSLAQMAAGLAPDPQPAIGQLWTAAGLALAMMAGLHIRLAAALILSYNLWPMGGLPAASDVVRLGLGQVAQGFALAVSLALPFVIGGFLYNLAMGLVNRAMPQLMVSLIGAPALALAGLILVMLATPALLEIWKSALAAATAGPFLVPQ